MKNRTAIGIVCIILAVAITFGISPLVNKMTEGKTQVVVFSKIDEADIWMPKGEVIKYYHSHKDKFKKRYEKSKCKEFENENREK